ncbi:MAG: diacylglycerol/lipid kinase family protein [Betaproteobacteria bacterium]
MRVLLVHNPGAGDDSTPGPGKLKELVKDAGHEFEFVPARGPEWKKALKDEKFDAVAVAGGDGTVAKVARRAIGRDIPIAVLPMGTANNIARTLGVRDIPIPELIAGWATAQRKHMDAGVVGGPWKSRYFIEAVGAGLFAFAIPDVDASPTMEKLKDAEAKATYAKQMVRERLKKCRPLELDIKLDGERHSGEYLLFEVMNIEFVGPNLYLAPRSVTDDGEFDVVLITEKQRRKLDDYLESWQEGVTLPPDFTTLKASRIEVNWTGFDVHIDDAVYPKKEKAREKAPMRLTIEIERDALEYLVPGRPDAPDKEK